MAAGLRISEARRTALRNPCEVKNGRYRLRARIRKEGEMPKGKEKARSKGKKRKPRPAPIPQAAPVMGPPVGAGGPMMAPTMAEGFPPEGRRFGGGPMHIGHIKGKNNFPKPL